MEKWSEGEWTADALIGGHAALDFVNTAGGRTKVRDVERLVDYAALLRWSLASGLLFEAEVLALDERADDEPQKADAALTATRAFRETLHACLMAEQAALPWPVTAGDAVEGSIREALARAHLRKAGPVFGWHGDLDDLGLELPLSRVALAAEDLLRHEDLPRMRNCDRCSWLFIDRGRGRSRRWCSMAACGSRAKSARYYRRSRPHRASAG